MNIWTLNNNKRWLTRSFLL